MTLRQATHHDAPQIGVLQASAPEASQWEPASYLQYDCLVAEEDARLLGFIVTRETAPREHEILNLVVDPEFRRKGVGTALLVQVLAAGGDWFLEVRQSNEGAQTLYRKLGFTRSGIRPKYYRDPDESGIVMRRGS